MGFWLVQSSSSRPSWFVSSSKGYGWLPIYERSQTGLYQGDGGRDWNEHRTQSAVPLRRPMATR